MGSPQLGTKYGALLDQQPVRYYIPDAVFREQIRGNFQGVQLKGKPLGY